MQIRLPNLDPAVGTDDFNEGFILWLSNIVDILNQDIDTLENAFAFMMAVSTASIGGMGAGPITVTVTNLPATGYVTAQIISTSNQVTISSIVITAGQFTIMFSSDPGASAIISYVAYTAQP